MIVNCVKCKKECDDTVFYFNSNRAFRIFPLLGNRRDDYVFLCGDCSEEWHLLFTSLEKKYGEGNVNKGNPNKKANWIYNWKKFLKGKVAQEKVSFT